MIQLSILAGGGAGNRIVAERFPLKAGRAPGNDLVLEDPGVFSEHFAIAFTSDGFVLSPQKQASLTLNGEPSAGGILRNGDIIGAGLAKVQFWLGALPQRGLRLREISAWFLIWGVVAAQVYFLWRLLEMAR